MSHRIAQVKTLQKELSAAQEQVTHLQNVRGSLQKESADLRAVMNQITHSKSYRMMEPVRQLRARMLRLRTPKD